METLATCAQYGDLKGFSAADWSDDRGHSRLLEAAGIGGGTLVGISIYAEHSQHVSLHVVEAAGHDDMMALVNNGTIHATKFDTKLTISDVLDCLKRFSVIFKQRDLKDVDITFDT